MEQKTSEKARHAELITKIDELKVQISAIGLIAMLDEFYTKDERTKLYKEHEALYSADEAARKLLFSNSAPADPAITAEQHHMSLYEAKLATAGQLDAFIDKHPMIVRLINLKGEVGKGKYE